MKTFIQTFSLILIISTFFSLKTEPFQIQDLFDENGQLKTTPEQIFTKICPIQNHPCHEDFPFDHGFPKKENTEHFNFLNAGAFGEAFVSSDHEFVVKVLRFQYFDSLWPEINIGLLIDDKKKSQNLATITECCADNPSGEFIKGKTRIFIKMPFYDNGDLIHFMNNQENKKTTRSLKWKYRLMAEVSNGLKDLHELGFAHNDLHTGNIFVTKENRFLIGDYGKSQYDLNRKKDIRELGQMFAYILNSDISYDFLPPWTDDSFCEDMKTDENYINGKLIGTKIYCEHFLQQLINPMNHLHSEEEIAHCVERIIVPFLEEKKYLFVDQDSAFDDGKINII